MHATTSMPDAPSIEKPGSPWYAHRWPWLLMLGPMLVVLAGSYTIWLAFSRQDAMVADDYYKQGKAINRDLRRDRAAANLGMKATMRFAPASGRLLGTVANLHGAQHGSVRLHLIHSTQPEKDLHLRVPLNGKGEFSAALPMLEKARWQVMMEDDAREWRLSGIWPWPQNQAVLLQSEQAAPAEQ